MKQFFKMFFASMLGFIIGSVVLFGVLIGIIVNLASSLKSDKPDKSSSVLVIKAGQKLHEQGEDNSLASFNKESPHDAGLYEAIRAIRQAKTDGDIKAILIKLDGASNGWATTQQLRDALVDFKTSHKKIFAYGESISQKDYYLATAADVIYLNPTSMLEIKGLAAQSVFFKGLLDKLEVHPEIYYAGRFKSATEPFRADKMSDANRIQTTELLHDIWDNFLAAAAAKTGSDTATIQHIAAANGLLFAGDAEKYKLIDGAKYWDEMEDAIRGVTNQKADEKIKYTSLDEYTEHLSDDNDGANKIAVLFAEGEIVDGEGGDYQIGSESLVKSIRELKRNDKIKAVVLRVNSPGGSALASEVMLRELQLLQQKKPLIVSMGDVAASGGYYISSNADSIFAMPNTITGSIGVFSMMFDISGLMKDKLGVTFDEVKNAPYADFPTASRPLNADEAARMQSTVDTIYSTFKSRVSKGRRLAGIMVDSIAQGRVWTGTDALTIGLVDGIGNLDRALRSAAAKAKLSSYSVTTYPEPVDQFKTMLKRLKGPMTAIAVRQAMQEELGPDYELYEQLQSLRRIRGKVQMAMPYRLNIE